MNCLTCASGHVLDGGLPDRTCIRAFWRRHTLRAHEAHADTNIRAARFGVLRVLDDEASVVHLRVGIDESVGGELRLEPRTPVRLGSWPQIGSE